MLRNRVAEKVVPTPEVTDSCRGEVSLGWNERKDVRAYEEEHKGQEVHLGVSEEVDDLRGAELGVGYAGLVGRDVLEESALLGVGHPWGLHRAVRDAKVDEATDDDGDAAENDEHDAPIGDGGVGDVLKTEGGEGTQDLAQTDAAVPQSEAGGLFGLGVPLTADDHEAGTDCGLKDTEEDTGDEETSVVTSGSDDSGGHAPEDSVDAEPSARRDLVEDDT